MPLYNYSCWNCQGHFTEWAPMDQSAEGIECPNCGKLAQRAVSAPRVISDYEGYLCPVTDKWIDGRAAHIENLKRTGSRVLETGEKEAAIARRAQEEYQFDRSLDETVERQLDILPSAAKEQLANELSSGIDAVVTRSTPNGN